MGHPQVKEAYMKCLREHNNEAVSCTEVAKLYLECRMERCAEHPAGCLEGIQPSALRCFFPAASTSQLPYLECWVERDTELDFRIQGLKI